MTAPSVAERLALQPGTRVWFDGVPDQVLGAIDADALQLDIELAATAGLDLAVIGSSDSLAKKLDDLAQLLQPAGAVWIVAGDTAPDAPSGWQATQSVPLDHGWHATRIVVAATTPSG
ncbi:hypothetical protein [Sphingomonas sp.]